MNNKIKNEAIILVHGIWMTGIELFYIRYKMWRQGYHVIIFHYQSLLKTPEYNAKKLLKWMNKIQEPTVHFVAHSLGGIVLTHLFANSKVDKPGKVVMLGTPINGSALAQALAKKKILKNLLGLSLEKGLLGDAPPWNHPRETCVFAGTKKIGVGMILAKSVMQKQNDGTVNLQETQQPLADKNYIMPLSHFSIIFSADVSDKIIKFLEE